MQPTLGPFLVGLAAAITTGSRPVPRQAGSGDYTMGFIGCSMAENVAQGYVANRGKHMWGPYGTAWTKFDQQVTRYGKPSEVWVMVCIFQNPGATYDEVKQVIANARQHAAAGAKIYITGQPIYPDNPSSCFLAGVQGPQLTVDLAKRAGADAALNVTYPGDFKLMKGEVQDGCHANTAGQSALGKQALAFWG